MKHLTYHFCIVLLLCLASSCAKIEVVSIADAPQRITYQTVKSPATKDDSSDNTLDFPETAKFRSYAYFLPKGMTWKDNYADGQLYINNSLVSYDASIDSWKDAEKDYYWPKEGSLTFFSWTDGTSNPVINDTGEADYPTTIIPDNLNFKMERYNMLYNKNQDLMFADRADDCTASGGEVPVVFRHMLSKIILKAKPANISKTTTKIHSVKFLNFTVECDYYPPENMDNIKYYEGWYPQGRYLPEYDYLVYSYYYADIPLFTNEAGEDLTEEETLSPSDSDYYIVIPQRTYQRHIDGGAHSSLIVLEVVYSITTQNPGTDPLTEMVTATKSFKEVFPSGLQIGCVYELTLDLSQTGELIFWKPKVTTWEPGTTNIVTQ